MKSAFFPEHDEQVDYYNELIEPYGEGIIILEHVHKILNFIKKFDKLDELYIDGNNYKDKVKGYNKHRKSLQEDYGYEISKNIPFDSPHELKLELDKYLEDIGLEAEQVTVLTKELVGSSRRPRKKDISHNIFVNKGRGIGLTDNLTPTRIRAFREEQKKHDIPDKLKRELQLDGIMDELDFFSISKAEKIQDHLDEYHESKLNNFLKHALNEKGLL